MFTFKRKPPTKLGPEMMTKEQGEKLATKTHQLVMSLACLQSNVVKFGQELAIHVMNGDLTEEDAADTANSLHNLSEDAERLCTKVDKIRNNIIAVPAPASEPK